VGLRSLAIAVGQQPWIPRLRRVIVPTDRLVSRLTRGKVITLGLVTALMLTTTGRRTGKPRTTPLLCVPDGGGFIVIGSNWGRPQHPAWALNLLANPDASIVHKGQRFGVRAESLAGPDRERAWQLVLEQWPAYQRYAEQAGRELHMFRLLPAAHQG
jgi:deazaflavin-dependent oxidoreductase (nitroreductase family)